MEVEAGTDVGKGAHAAECCRLMSWPIIDDSLLSRDLMNVGTGGMVKRRFAAVSL